MKDTKPSAFWLVLLLLWIKTIIVGLTEFQISIHNINQFFILIINPIPILLLIITFILTRKSNRQSTYLLLFMLVTTFIMYANVVYYREFTDFITIPLLFMGNNIADLSNSIHTLIKPYDIIYFIDILVVGTLIIKWHKTGKFPEKKHRFSELRPYYVVIIILTMINIGLANIERPQLLTRTFDRELLVKNLGIYNFHAYDVYLHTMSRAPRVFANEGGLEEVNEYIGDEETSKEEDLFGIAEGRNVIFVAAESIQSFVINETINGEEITPFLNELINESLYFEEFYHQTAQGKSSDSEFLINNSLYPSARGAVFFSHVSNEYYALPEIMGENGYYTSSMHGNNGSFWNRNVMYNQLGYDRFYTKDDYQITEKNSIGWGLKDIPFMEQSVDHMLEMPQPFYTKLITLTNHFPFELEEDDMYIDRYESNSNTLNKYFPTVRYMDESIKVLFERLKEDGLYEDSIIIIYGDHDGISSNHNQAMSQFLEKDINEFEEIKLQQVPLIIHIPGVDSKTISTVSGQIDIRPTLLHLMGVEVENQTIFGNNLFSEEREELVILRNGSFITEEAIFVNNTCYVKATGEPTEEPLLCDPFIERVQEELEYSDSIIYGDLLRFHEKQMKQPSKLDKNEKLE
ncbi:LTA synthase family protein [Salipaludibacillus daqingensis]|uniref:LTA synthase family protein n=1 Tax=Salipaludibacillus daqingensis TaxID=3041001 RepID=UPI00247376F8|nr:LTA synthase family protein [Salipaludibacillus daqingensis]